MTGLVINYQLESIIASTGILSLNGMTGGIILPRGTTPFRPSIGTADAGKGLLRFNTDSGNVEFSNGTTWIQLGTGALTSISTGTGLTGGPITTGGTISVAINGISNTLLRSSAPQSLMGNSAGSYATVQDIFLGNGLSFSAGTLNVAVNAEIVARTVTQASHGFAVGNVLRHNGVSYVLAQANSSINAEVIGIVAGVSSINAFTLIVSGRISGLSGLTAGAAHFLSAVTPGLLTATAPSTVGNISKPILIADSTTSGFYANMRGSAVSVASSESAYTLLGNPNGTAQAAQEVHLGAGLSFSGGTLNNTGLVTSITAGTGLTGGTITTIGTIAMATSGVTAGTYGSSSLIPKVTVDALGRITAISTSGIGSVGIAVIRTQVFSASGTYIPHPSMLYCDATVVGGGGGGGSSYQIGYPGLAKSGGGGAGGWSQGIISNATIGASQIVTIGAAGAGAVSGSGATSGNIGGAGGVTSLGSLLSATGGAGGGSGHVVSFFGGSSHAGGDGGTGGSGPSGSASQNGGFGGKGTAGVVYNLNTTTWEAFSGVGGNSIFSGPSSNVSGVRGAGGNGGGSTGDSGGPGYVIITEYCSA